MNEAHFKAEKKILPKKNNLAFQLYFPSYGIFPTRNALKLTFVFFQLQLYSTLQGQKWGKMPKHGKQSWKAKLSFLEFFFSASKSASSLGGLLRPRCPRKAVIRTF